MAAVTGPGSTLPPPAGRRGRVLVWVAVAWGVLLVGLAVWSVGHSPATVPEQRTIGQAMPELQEAAGVVFAAAAGPGRAVQLGGLQVAPGCRVTPVRHGVSVTRDVTVYVRAGDQRADIETIAAALPARYQVEVTPSRGGTRFELHADAGNFIGIDMDATIGDSSLTLRLSSGCRPVGDGGVVRTDPSAGPAPAALRAALVALGAPERATRLGAGGAGSDPTTGSSAPPGGRTGSPPSAAPDSQPSAAPDSGPSAAPDSGPNTAPDSGPSASPNSRPSSEPGSRTSAEAGARPTPAGPIVQSVRCPGGGTAGTYTVGEVPAPGDWVRRLGKLASGAAVVRSDTSRWAYRTGNDSVVVVSDGHDLTISASTSC